MSDIDIYVNTGFGLMLESDVNSVLPIMEHWVKLEDYLAEVDDASLLHVAEILQLQTDLKAANCFDCQGVGDYQDQMCPSCNGNGDFKSYVTELLAEVERLKKCLEWRSVDNPPDVWDDGVLITDGSSWVTMGGEFDDYENIITDFFPIPVRPRIRNKIIMSNRTKAE